MLVAFNCSKTVTSAKLTMSHMMRCDFFVGGWDDGRGARYAMVEATRREWLPGCIDAHQGK
jgi:hypothetical protein